MSVSERIRTLEKRGFLEPRQAESLLGGKAILDIEYADTMIENVIGVFGLPLAVAPNFRVNKTDYVAPMVVEEASIVAGVSGAAKLFRDNGGFEVTCDDPILIGQIQLVDIDDPDAAINTLHSASGELLALANESQPRLVARGGGAREIEYFKYRLPDNRWTVTLHILVDTRDAMGANMVNTICETLAPRVADLSGGRVCLRILSNLADRSMVTASGTVRLAQLGGEGFTAEEVRDGIILANDVANSDPFRAATHNKGILNGVDALALATGNDWRSIEASAHAFAVRDKAYRSLTKWTRLANGDLQGELRLPLRAGIVGGSQTANPGAALGLALCGARTGTELTALMGAVGLAQNFAALRALVTHGIQKGHMGLHARNLAASAGAPAHLVETIAAEMVVSGDIKSWKANELVESMQERDRPSSRIAPDDGATGKAAGKVILLGEHAVVYDRHALALPVEEAVTATIATGTTKNWLEIPDWGISQAWPPGAPVEAGPAEIVELIMQKMDVRGEPFNIVVESRIPLAMGLGASAAFSVALIRAFDQLLGKKMSNAQVDAMAYDCERISHGSPSGIDNNIATYAEPVLYSKSNRTRTRPLQLIETPPLVIASSGIRASTRDQVAGVRERHDRNTALYETLFSEIDEISVAGSIALKSGDYSQLGDLMNVCHGLLNALEVSTPELEKMIAIARDCGAVGAKLTGAGGGGSIVALCPDKEAEVTAMLGKAGYQIVHMTALQPA